MRHHTEWLRMKKNCIIGLVKATNQNLQSGLCVKIILVKYN